MSEPERADTLAEPGRAPAHERPTPNRKQGFERLILFGDAVFAIAITLLVIELRLPELGPNATESEVEHALAEVSARVEAYVQSFAVIGLYWFGHWQRFQDIERVNSPLAIINLVFLGCIAVIPFPTTVIGAHGDVPAVIVLYALTLAVAGVVGALAWLYAWRAGLTPPNLDPALVRLYAVRALVVPVVMVLSLPLLLVGPWITKASWLLIFPIYALIGWRRRNADRAASI